jgi:hypothetical protein
MLVHSLLMRISKEQLVGQRLVLPSQMVLWHAINCLFLGATGKLRHVIVKRNGLIEVHLHRLVRVADHAALALLAVA